MTDQIEMQEVGRFERMLTLRVPEADLDAAKTRAARRISRELKIKGFRPGKAPRRIVEATVGEDRVRGEALEEVLPDLVGAALESADVEPAVPASVEHMRDVEDGLEVDVKVTLWPTLDTVPTWQGREVEIPSPTVDAEEIESQMERLLEQFAELATVERSSEPGDYVSININASRDGEGLPEASAQDLLYEVGSATFLDGLDEAATGVATGEIVSFDTVLPDAFGELAGAAVDISVLVKEVKEKKLPELDDEWVSDFTEFETEAELREEMETRLSQMKLDAARNQFQGAVVDSLVNDLEVDIPEGIVNGEMEELLHRFAHQLGESGIEIADYLEITGLTQEAFVEDLRGQATHSVSTSILLDAVAAAEGLEVEDQERETLYAVLGQQADEDPAVLAERLAGSVQEKRMVGDILRRKALRQVMLGAVPVDENGSPIDLALDASDEGSAEDATVVDDAVGDDAVGDGAGGDSEEE